MYQFLPRVIWDYLRLRSFFVLSTSCQFLYNIDKIFTESTGVLKRHPIGKLGKKLLLGEKEVIKFAPLLPLNHNPSADFHCWYQFVNLVCLTFTHFEVITL